MPSKLVAFVSQALKAFAPYGRVVKVEYHARRTEADPKKWRVVEVTVVAGDIVNATVNELATDLKRNRAEALVKLLRSNHKES